MALRERARSNEDKALRRRAILDAARTLFAARGLAGFAMADVAERAGVARATLYLYWPTREELLLAVLEELLWQWLDELDGRLDETRVPVRRAQAGDHHLRLARRPTSRSGACWPCCRRCSSTTCRARRSCASRASSGCAWRPPARASSGRFRSATARACACCLHSNALLVGLVQMADSAPLVQEVLSQPPLTALKVELPRELREALITYFVGLIGR